MVKQSAELWAVCGNIVRSQRVSWFPLCAARHLHNLCNSYQEFDTVLNSDICTMLIDGCCFFVFFGLACAHLCWWCRKMVRFEVHTNIHAVDLHVGQCDPVCGALASGYLEVSGDVVSACWSGFIIFSLIRPCINLAEDFTVRGKSLCCLSTVL